MINDFIISKTNDLGHKFTISIQHPKFEYIMIIDILMLDSAPVFKTYWPEDRQGFPTFSFGSGAIKEINKLFINNFHSNSCILLPDESSMYFDVMMKLEHINNCKIAVNMSNRTIFIICNDELIFNKCIDELDKE